MVKKLHRKTLMLHYAQNKNKKHNYHVLSPFDHFLSINTIFYILFNYVI